MSRKLSFAMIALVLVGCDGDFGGNPAPDEGAGGSQLEVIGGANSGGSTGTTSASGGATTSTTVLCDPLWSYDCECGDGTLGAMECSADGQSYSVCACQETLPSGYSGECVSVGFVAAACGGTSSVELFVNCETTPPDRACYGASVKDAFCCAID